jgi:hypothetical protein
MRPEDLQTNLLQHCRTTGQWKNGQQQIQVGAKQKKQTSNENVIF